MIVSRHDEFNAFKEAYIAAGANATSSSQQTEGLPQVVVVTGQSGIGKSFFVEQSLDTLCGVQNNNDGIEPIIVSGKCNELSQNQPYGCIVDALTMLGREISRHSTLLTPDSSFQQELLESLKGEAQVLVDLVPTLVHVIGDNHHTVMDLKGKERQVRLLRVVRRLLKFVAAQCPLIIVTDDLQWSDESTLNLLHSLATSTNMNGLLLVCTYRVPCSKKMLSEFFMQLQEGEDACITNIGIQPLSKVETRGLFHLKVDNYGATVWSDFLYSHTNGHTFFAVRLSRYLLSLDGIDKTSLQNELERLSIPPTLNDLLELEINELPPFARDLLLRASCIGAYFDKIILKTSVLLPAIDDAVTNTPSFKRTSCMTEAIQTAINMKIIQEVGNNLGYRFVHDSLHKTCYSMIDESSRNNLHLEIGRAMRNRMKPSIGRDCNAAISTRKIGVSKTDMNSFINRYLTATVDQLNLGKDLIIDQTETNELFMMNIKAAELAMLESSWESALLYLNSIISSLQYDEHFVFRYDLALSVNMMYAEVNLVLRNFDSAQSTIDIILRNGKTLDDKYDAYLLLMRLLYAQQMKNEAMCIASDVLDQLGVQAGWLKEDLSSVAERRKLQRKIQKAVKKLTSCKKLASMKQITDERKLKAIKIFYWLIISCYGSILHELVTGSIFLLTIEYGYCEESLNAVLTYASGYLPFKKKFDISKAISSLQRDEDSHSLKHDYCLIQGGYLQCWYEPLSAQPLSTLGEGRRVGTMNGHVDNAGMCGSLLISYSLFSGERLSVVDDRINAYVDWATDCNLYKSVRLTISPFIQLVKCLREGDGGSSLVGEVMDLGEIEAAAKSSTMIKCTLVLCRIELACITGDYNLAGEILTDAPDLLAARPGHFSGCRYTVYEFLASSKLARQTKMKTWRKRADKSAKQIKSWADDGNVNVKHLLPLVKAEVALMKGKNRKARKFFSNIMVEEGLSNHFLQDQALALERAGDFFLLKNDRKSAASCYIKSQKLFLKWGAKAKAQSLGQ